jgi:hypothetical protein
MWKASLGVGMCWAAGAAFAAMQQVQPLNVKTGLWQITQTVTWTGLPPQLEVALQNGRKVAYKSCVKTDDLSTNPWADGSGQDCHWTVLNSNGTDMEVKGTSCDLGKDFGMTAEVHGTIHVVDPENGTGSMRITLSGNGLTLNGQASYTGKWIAARCPATN